MRTTQSGDTMATFSIAVSEKWNDKQGSRQEKTEWVNIQAFGKLAEIMGQYLTKGSQVFISGKFQSRKFTGQDGVQRTAVSILAQTMQMLSSGQNNQQQGNQGYPQQGQWQGQGGYNQPPQGQWQQPPNTSPQGYPQGGQGRFVRLAVAVTAVVPLGCWKSREYRFGWQLDSYLSPVIS